MVVDYGGVTLSLSDALYAHNLDCAIEYAQTGWSPMRMFDPVDTPRLFVQDAIAASGGGLPDIYTGWYGDLTHGVTQPRWAGADSAFAVYAVAMRNALLMPFCAVLHDALADLWAAWGVPEGERRIADQERRLQAKLRYGDGPGWESADLLAEVGAVCGEGRKQGRQWAFLCPFHNDRHPSLMVDPDKKVWTCWPCHKGGGVVAWRRAFEK